MVVGKSVNVVQHDSLTSHNYIQILLTTFCKLISLSQESSNQSSVLANKCGPFNRPFHRINLFYPLYILMCFKCFFLSSHVFLCHLFSLTRSQRPEWSQNDMRYIIEMKAPDLTIVLPQAADVLPSCVLLHTADLCLSQPRHSFHFHVSSKENHQPDVWFHYLF